MSTEKTPVPLSPEDIVPNDLVSTLWRWSVKNNWRFAPDLTGQSEPWIDIRCAAALVAAGNSLQSVRTTQLAGVRRVSGMVKLSEVVKACEEKSVS